MLGESAVRDHYVEQAGWCLALGSPFTAALLAKFASDLDTGGPVHALTADWTTNPRKDALGLRLAGALHHGVLTGRAPELAALYPAQAQAWDMEAVWPVARDWLAANLASVAQFIEGAPQTNETRRCIALLPGFLDLAARFDMPMHLLEMGASAGLNQNWDRYTYETASWSRAGSSDVKITTDWTGPVPRHLDVRTDVASRAACDLYPVDLGDADAVFRLKCYTWADQTERLSRQDGAIRLAQATGVRVEQADAADWILRKLADRPGDGLTVVFHSAFLIYPPRDAIEQIMSAIARAGEAATARNPLAWLCYESEALFGGDRTSPAMDTRLQVWPGGAVRQFVRSDGHVTKVTAFDA